jgi:hypothetical protein
MIVEGFVDERRKGDKFIVKAQDGNSYQFTFNRYFAQEFARLNGHACARVAQLVPGIGVHLEITDGKVLDVRFDVPDIFERDPEISTVCSVSSSCCFLERQCHCTVFLSYFRVGKALKRYFEGFQKGAQVRHRVADSEKGMEATDPEILNGEVTTTALQVLGDSDNGVEQ